VTVQENQAIVVKFQIPTFTDFLSYTQIKKQEKHQKMNLGLLVLRERKKKKKKKARGAIGIGGMHST
jgi:hypothetical protein